MVDQELIERVTRLPVRERLELIEVLTRSLRSDLSSNSTETTIGAAQSDLKHASDVYQPAQEERAAALNRLFGALTNDNRPPTDEELKEDYINYLIRKYE